MRTKLLFLIFAIMLSGIVYAQDRPNRQGQRQGQNPQGQRMSVEERAKNQADRLKKELTLTDVQYDSVKAIQLRHAKKMDESFRNQSQSTQQSDRREAFQKSQEELSKNLKRIFTADQYKKYEELLKQRGNGRNGERPQRQN